jgi:hypothetical protein
MPAESSSLSDERSSRVVPFVSGSSNVDKTPVNMKSAQTGKLKIC